MAINKTSPKKGKVVDIPDAVVTIGTPTAGDASVSVAFTASSPTTGGPVQKYTAISSPGSFTGTASSSPVVVTGLTNGTAYTFTVAAGNATGNGVFSSASASATPLAATSFESIATVSLTSAQASITFSSIPSTYKHLQVRMISRDSNADTNINSLYMNFNGVTGTSYSWHKIEALGTGTPNSNGIASQGSMWIGGNTANNYTSGIYAAHITDIMDYTNTGKYKTIKTLGGFDTNGTGTEPGHVTLTSGTYMSTDAITSITITKSGQNQLANSHFALYGIKG